MVKKIFKFVGALIVGIVIGLSIATLIVVLFTDLTFSEYLQKFTTTKISESLGAALVGIVSCVIAFPLHIVLHEGGHLVCGVLSGYRFVSFRIFNRTFIRQDGKIRIKKFAVDGTGGQCLLAPPEKPLEEIPVTVYNLGGVLANVLAVCMVLPLFWVVDQPYAIEFLLFFCLVGAFLIVMNGIPMKVGGINNDAYNVLLLRRDKESKRALITQLRANALVQQGSRPKEIPLEWFAIEGEMNYKNPLLLSLYLMKASCLLDCGQYEEAHRMFEEAYRHKSEMIGLYVKEVACELIFTSLCLGDTKLADELYTDALKKYIHDYRKVMSSKERILCAVAKYMEKDEEKARNIYQSVCRRQEAVLMQGEVKSDIALMEAVLSHV